MTYYNAYAIDRRDQVIDRATFDDRYQLDAFMSVNEERAASFRIELRES